MAWIVRLVSIGAEGEEHSTAVMRIAKPDTLADLGTLGLSLAESKQLLAGIQREIVAAQARVHAVHRPECRGCGAACRVKDYRHHAIATPFGQVAVRLPRFRSLTPNLATVPRQSGKLWLMGQARSDQPRASPVGLRFGAY